MPNVLVICHSGKNLPRERAMIIRTANVVSHAPSDTSEGSPILGTTAQTLKADIYSHILRPMYMNLSRCSLLQFCGDGYESCIVLAKRYCLSVTCRWHTKVVLLLDTALSSKMFNSAGCLLLSALSCANTVVRRVGALYRRARIPGSSDLRACEVSANEDIALWTRCVHLMIQQAIHWLFHALFYSRTVSQARLTYNVRLTSNDWLTDRLCI